MDKRQTVQIYIGDARCLSHESSLIFYEGRTGNDRDVMLWTIGGHVYQRMLWYDVVSNSKALLVTGAHNIGYW